MQYRTRDLLMRRLAQLINALRAHLSELGIAAAQRCAGIAPTSWPNDRLFAALHESVRGTFETCRAALNMSGYWVPAQPVDATQALNLSAGALNCKVSGGRSFG
jgi:hypothetical protein